jgi:hypothetical protein
LAASDARGRARMWTGLRLARTCDSETFGAITRCVANSG